MCISAAVEINRLTSLPSQPVGGYPALVLMIANSRQLETSPGNRRRDLNNRFSLPATPRGPGLRWIAFFRSAWGGRKGEGVERAVAVGVCLRQHWAE